MLARISKRTVDAAVVGRESTPSYGTESVKRLRVKVTPAGAKIYVLQYRCKGSATAIYARRARLALDGRGSPAEAKRLLFGGRARD